MYVRQSFVFEKSQAPAVRAYLNAQCVNYSEHWTWLGRRRFKVTLPALDRFWLEVDMQNLGHRGILGRWKPVASFPKEFAASSPVQPHVAKGVAEVHPPHVPVSLEPLLAGDVKVDQPTQGN